MLIGVCNMPFDNFDVTDAYEHGCKVSSNKTAKKCPQCNKPLKKDAFGYYCPVHGCEGEEGYWSVNVVILLFAIDAETLCKKFIHGEIAQ